MAKFVHFCQRYLFHLGPLLTFFSTSTGKCHSFEDIYIACTFYYFLTIFFYNLKSEIIFFKIKKLSKFNCQNIIFIISKFFPCDEKLELSVAGWE